MTPGSPSSFGPSSGPSEPAAQDSPESPPSPSLEPSAESTGGRSRSRRQKVRSEPGPPRVGAPVSWVATASELQRLIEQVAEGEQYAIDTEFLRERSYYPNLALVQIAWDGGIALIDPLDLDLTPLAELFNSDRLAIVHAAEQDLEVLEASCGAVPSRIFDTQLAAGFVGLSTPSLSTLAERLLGIYLSKGDRLTDWTQRPLTGAQESYAAADVAHLFELKSLIVVQLEESGRLEWAEEECEILRSRPRNQVQLERAWWRLKDGRVLRGRDRLIAQELCAWRERKAQQVDRPVRFILPDLAVVTIAQSKPTSVEALAGQRGLDGRYGKAPTGREIIDAVERGLQLPLSELQLPEPDDFDRRLRPALTLVSAWISQLARDVRIDASLLATRSDLVSFLRNDAGARLSRGWRAAVVGEAVQKLVRGDAALAFEAGGSLTLELRSRQPIGPIIPVPDVSWGDPDVLAAP